MKIMQGTNNKQAGFSIVEIVLTVVAVGMVVGAGWFAYQHNKPKAGNAAPDTNQSTNNPDIGQPKPTVAYLEVKEWGVKIPLSESIKDAYYVVGKGSSEGPGRPPTRLWLGLKSRGGTNCNPDNNNRGKTGAIGGILRFPPTETDPISGELLVEEFPAGTLLGDYYYTYQSWTTRNPCDSESTLEEVDSAFYTAAKAIVPIQADKNN